MDPLIQRVPDLRGQLRDQLERRLRSGYYPEDVKLLEHSVAREFSVSRTPAREALAMLAREGLLVREGRGYQRVRFSATDIQHVFEARRRLEPYAVRLVADKASEPELESIQNAFNVLAESVEDGNAYIDALAALRKCLFAPSRNESLIRLIASFEVQVGYIRTKTLKSIELRTQSVQGNSRLVESILARNEVAAERDLLELLNMAEQACMVVLQ